MANSIYEVEYITASDVVKKAMLVRKFITELRVAPSLDDLVLPYCDSTGTIVQAKKLKVH